MKNSDPPPKEGLPYILFISFVTTFTISDYWVNGGRLKVNNHYVFTDLLGRGFRTWGLPLPRPVS